MGLRERLQVLRARIDEEFNPGMDGDPAKVAELQRGLGIAGINGSTEITASYSTPTITDEGKVAEDDKKED